MQISGSIALVTGANRGLGRQFAAQLIQRGATKVYATARRPELVDIPGAEVLRLDITDPASVAAAAEAAADVTLLVNNAGVATRADLVGGDLDLIRQEMDTHFWGTLHMVRAFAPRLAGGAILNVLSALSWFSGIGAGGYAAAKAAEWNLTNGVRLELAAQKTLVTALHLGAADTDMMAGVDVPKSDPADVVRAALDGIEANSLEVLADGWSAQAKTALAADPSAFYPQAVF
jgi:NAD(P)-dependent dehydrogenase (short-subunit alcohol dehydrogenase family)